MEFKQAQQTLDQARVNTADSRDTLYTLQQKLANVERQQAQLARGFDSRNEVQQQHKEALAKQTQTLNAT